MTFDRIDFAISVGCSEPGNRPQIIILLSRSACSVSSFAALRIVALDILSASLAARGPGIESARNSFSEAMSSVSLPI